MAGIAEAANYMGKNLTSCEWHPQTNSLDRMKRRSGCALQSSVLLDGGVFAAVVCRLQSSFSSLLLSLRPVTLEGASGPFLLGWC